MVMAGQEVPSKPTIPNKDILQLRIRLILEELVELSEASGYDINVNGINIQKNLSNIALVPNGKEPDLVAMADAITDIDYVNTGAACAYGMDLEPLHDEVHSSNMSKLWTFDDIQNEFRNFYHIYNTENNSFINKENGDEYVVRVLKSGKGNERIWGVFFKNKLKKSPTYTPANLEKIINL